MRTVLRWLRRIALAVVVLALVALAVVYALSERTLRRSYDLPSEESPTLPTDSASMAEGRRLARLRGCYDGCHGEGYSGGEFFAPGGILNVIFGRLIAPDLTRKVAELSETQLERAIRHGRRPNGRNVTVMPSNMLQHLSDEDFAKIVADLKGAPRTDGPDTDVSLGPIARWLMVTGTFRSPAAEVSHATPHPDRTPTEPGALGRYLALTVCVECHGARLDGGDPAPPLAVVAGYTPEQFTRLMSMGVPADGRELALMKEVAEGRFSHFTPEEVDALYGFLSTRERVGDLDLHSASGGR